MLLHCAHVYICMHSPNLLEGIYFSHQVINLKLSHPQYSKLFRSKSTSQQGKIFYENQLYIYSTKSFHHKFSLKPCALLASSLNSIYTFVLRVSSQRIIPLIIPMYMILLQRSHFMMTILLCTSL